MRMKLTALSVLAALLALALAAAAPASQFTSNVEIRFVEVTEIPDPPIPLADGAGGTRYTGGAVWRARGYTFQMQ